MSTDNAMKISADHLRRDAFLYVRQSSLRQVFEHTESTKRQYALRDRAVALRWPIERVHVIDNDLGLSGAQSQDRDGFQRLVAHAHHGRKWRLRRRVVQRSYAARPEGHHERGRTPHPEVSTARAAFSTRRVVASSSCRCRSDWSTRLICAWCSIRIARSRTRCACCSIPSGRWAQPVRSCAACSDIRPGDT